MANGPEQLRRDILAAKNEFTKGLINVAETMALNAKAYVETKLRSEGVPGEKYSDNAIPVYWLFESAKTEAAKDKISKLSNQRRKEARKGKGSLAQYGWESSYVSYKDLREAEGLPVDKVNLSFSNEMLRGWIIIEVENIGTFYVAKLGGKVQDVINKLAWQRDHYGDWVSKILGEEGKAFLKSIMARELDKMQNK